MDDIGLAAGIRAGQDELAEYAFAICGDAAFAGGGCLAGLCECFRGAADCDFLCACEWSGLLPGVADDVDGVVLLDAVE